MSTKIFLTSDRIYPNFSIFCKERGLELLQKSGIAITFLDFHWESEPEWLFFSSRNAVKSFLKANKNYHGKIACLGPGTANEFKETEFSPDFVGDVNQTPDEVAKSFGSILQSEGQVIHLAADLSTHVLTRNKLANVIELSCYKTEIMHLEIPKDVHVVVATSPSNVNAIQGLPDEVHFVAIGATTLQAIQKRYPSHKAVQSKRPDEKGWMDAMIELGF